MRRIVNWCAAGLVAIATLLPRAPVGAAQPHVLRMADGQDVTTLDPFLATTANIVSLSQLTMAHFVRFDVHDRAIPELIVAIPTRSNGGISRDGRSITYRLRRGVKWSDGTSFDADDVMYTLAVIANPANNITTRDAWDRVTGADEPDKYTVVIHLKTPYAPFYSRFFSSSGLSCVLPKHLLGKSTLINDVAYNALPVGIGPFRYSAFRRGDAVEMEANPYYFRGLPKLHKIVYKTVTDQNTLFAQVQTGELDLWAEPGGTFFDRLKTLPNVRVPVVPTPYMSAIYFNNDRPVVRDRLVRRALRLATDREALLKNVFHNSGTLAESVVARVSEDFDPALPQARYDPAAAQRLLERAGWTRGADGMRSKGGVRLVIEIALPSGYPPSASAAEILRASWQRVGVAVETRSYSSAQFFGAAAAGGIVPGGKFDAAMLSLPGGVLADESLDYGCDYAAPKGFNDSHYCNRAVDALMQAYVATYDARQRAELARKFQRQIDDDAPAIVLYERSFAYPYAARVTGFVPSAFGPFDNFLEVDVRQ